MSTVPSASRAAACRRCAGRSSWRPAPTCRTTGRALRRRGWARRSRAAGHHHATVAKLDGRRCQACDQHLPRGRECVGRRVVDHDAIGDRAVRETPARDEGPSVSQRDRGGANPARPTPRPSGSRCRRPASTVHSAAVPNPTCRLPRRLRTKHHVIASWTVISLSAGQPVETTRIRRGERAGAPIAIGAITFAVLAVADSASQMPSGATHEAMRQPADAPRHSRAHAVERVVAGPDKWLRRPRRRRRNTNAEPGGLHRRRALTLCPTERSRCYRPLPVAAAANHAAISRAIPGVAPRCTVLPPAGARARHDRVRAAFGARCVVVPLGPTDGRLPSPRTGRCFLSTTPTRSAEGQLRLRRGSHRHLHAGAARTERGRRERGIERGDAHVPGPLLGSTAGAGQRPRLSRGEHAVHRLGPGTGRTGTDGVRLERHRLVCRRRRHGWTRLERHGRIRLLHADGRRHQRVWAECAHGAANRCRAVTCVRAWAGRPP